MQPRIFFSCKKAGPGNEISDPRGCMPTTVQVPPGRKILNAWVAAAGTPIASNEYSTPWPPVISMIASSRLSVWELIVCVAPKREAMSSLDSTMSIATILAAPAMRQPWMILSPIPPQPITATVEPPGTSAVYSAAPTPVITPQPISAASAIGISSGILTIPFSEVTIISAKEPTEANCRMGCPFQVSRWA